MGKNEPVTIRDISRALNISTTSVHRALTGKEGISEQLREKVLLTASEMGYEANFAASSLKRKPIRIAAVLPSDEGKYFLHILKGLRCYAQEVRGLNVEVEELLVQDEVAQQEKLKEIADQGNAYAGVLTYSFSQYSKTLLQLQRLVSQKTATVVLDDEIHEPEGLCCIPANAKVVGEVAAEFISLVTPETGTVVITRGREDSETHKIKLECFRSYIAEHKPGLRVVEIGGYHRSAYPADTYMEDVQAEIEKNSQDLVAAFAMTSLDNKPLVDGVQRAGLLEQVSLIGTDLNEETAEYLRNGLLKAVVNQAAFMKGYQGLRILMDKLMKQEKLPDRIDCPIDLVLKSNLKLFEETKFLNQKVDA